MSQRNGEESIFIVEQNHLQAHATDLDYIHSQELPQQDIIAKQDTIFLGEEILELFMASMVKTQLSVLAQKIPAL
jgi:hypothetical protein